METRTTNREAEITWTCVQLGVDPNTEANRFSAARLLELEDREREAAR